MSPAAQQEVAEQTALSSEGLTSAGPEAGDLEEGQGAASSVGAAQLPVAGIEGMLSVAPDAIAPAARASAAMAAGAPPAADAAEGVQGPLVPPAAPVAEVAADRATEAGASEQKPEVIQSTSQGTAAVG